jgi:hypothetical protein
MKSNKTFRAIAAFALAFALALTGFAPVFAADPPTDVSTGELGAAITKYFETPEGTEIPTDAKFTFTFTPYGVGSDGVNTDKEPDITPVEITLAGAALVDTTGGIATYLAEEGLIDLPDGAKFKTTATPKAGAGVGQYMYTVTETSAVYDPIANTTIYTHESDAEYILSLYVEEDPAGSAGDLYIAYITANATADDTGSYIPTEPKVDPTPGAHGMAFTNTYVRANDGGGTINPITYASFFVSKELTGSATDDIYFPFSVRVTNPDIVIDTDEPLPTAYKAYLLNIDNSSPAESWDANDLAAEVADGLIEPGGTDTLADGFKYYYYTFPAGTPATKEIWLKPDQKIAFVEAPVGAGWQAVETLASHNNGYDFSAYTGAVDVTVNNLTVTRVGTKGQDVDTLARLVGMTNTKAEFLNDTDPVLPMGLDINNLPYYGLILLALLALAAYVAVKARRRRQSAYDFDTYNA